MAGCVGRVIGGKTTARAPDVLCDCGKSPGFSGPRFSLREDISNAPAQEEQMNCVWQLYCVRSVPPITGLQAVGSPCMAASGFASGQIASISLWFSF